MNASRRLLLVAALGFPLTGVALSSPNTAPYPQPGKPIRLVVPAPPGGPGDVVARALARELTASLGVPVVVENKAGGASIPGALEGARAPADGHTLVLTLNTTHTQVPHLYSKLPFDPFRDFTPIAQIYRGNSVLVAHPSFPANSVAEAIAASRTGNVAFGSPSVGTSGHLFIETLNADHGGRFVHVPYKGSMPASQDLLAGHVQLLFDSPATALPHIRSGRLKVLASTGIQRLAVLPDVPTMQELGYAGFERATWLGVFGPAKLPTNVVERLNREIVTAAGTPELREQFSKMGVELVATSPQAFAELVRQDHDAWGKVIRRINLKLD